MKARIALQLYSIREFLEQDFTGTLKKVKACGFDAVEFAGYYGYPAASLKQMLTDLGLEPYSSHVPFEMLRDHPDEAVAFAHELGLSYVICPGAPLNSQEDIRQAAAVLNHAAAKLRPLGIGCGYHNHFHEFDRLDGQYIEDLLLGQLSDPDYIAQIDTCWIAYAGVDYLPYIDALGRHAGPLHFKELGTGFKRGSQTGLDVEVGRGVIDFPGVLALMKRNGTLERGVIIEQEGYQDEPFTVLKRSVDYLRSVWPQEA
ncbi:MAG: sugar phosphate isomerase/epimerase [Oscillospiraceae bacterium]|nr:sugar phosphate isomerase/epimerase [Oscillospiraceae bacterium]